MFGNQSGENLNPTDIKKVQKTYLSDFKFCRYTTDQHERNLLNSEFKTRLPEAVQR